MKAVETQKIIPEAAQFFSNKAPTDTHVMLFIYIPRPHQDIEQGYKSQYPAKHIKKLGET